MSANTKPSNKSNTGITGIRFLIYCVIGLAALFGTGWAFAPAGTITSFSGIVKFLLSVTEHVGIAAIIAFVLIVIVFTQVLDVPFLSIGKKFDEDHNLSYGLIAAGLVGVCAIAVFMASASSFQLYVYELLTKGSVGLFFSIVVTVIAAVFFGIDSMDSFRDYVEAPANNQKVLLLMVILNLVMFGAMSLHS